SANESKYRLLCAGRVESWYAVDSKSWRTLRPAISQDGCHGQGQYLAARRVCVVAVRVTADGGSRKLWFVLRPRAAAGGGQRALIEREHNGDRRGKPVKREPIADSGWRSCVPQHSSQ